MIDVVIFVVGFVLGGIAVVAVFSGLAGTWVPPWWR